MPWENWQYTATDGAWEQLESQVEIPSLLPERLYDVRWESLRHTYAEPTPRESAELAAAADDAAQDATVSKKPRRASTIRASSMQGFDATPQRLRAAVKSAVRGHDQVISGAPRARGDPEGSGWSVGLPAMRAELDKLRASAADGGASAPVVLLYQISHPAA
jgi:hypothetical protein